MPGNSRGLVVPGQNAGVKTKSLSPVTAHLLEAALPALAFQFTDEGLAGRIAGGDFDEHPRWLQWLTISKPFDMRRGGMVTPFDKETQDKFHGKVEYTLDEETLREWIRTDQRKACFVLSEMSRRGVWFDGHFDNTLPDELKASELASLVSEEVDAVVESHEYEDEELYIDEDEYRRLTGLETD